MRVARTAAFRSLVELFRRPPAPWTAHQTPEQLRQHYEIEKELAAKLRRASKAERRQLYSDLYDEMLRKVPSHPMLNRKADPAGTRRFVRSVTAIVERYISPGETYLEVGPGDCAVCAEIARIAKHAYAVDVSDEITRGGKLPKNCTLIISDGSSIAVEPESVDLAFSNQLIEHLHPDDVTDHLRNVVRALRTGGRYLCTTPNRLTGPWDVSRSFDSVATCFHLREYTTAELAKMFKAAGLDRIRAILGARGVYFEVPIAVMAVLEALASVFPVRLLMLRPMSWFFLSVTLVGTKSARDTSRAPNDRC